MAVQYLITFQLPIACDPAQLSWKCLLLQMIDDGLLITVCFWGIGGEDAYSKG